MNVSILGGLELKSDDREWFGLHYSDVGEHYDLFIENGIEFKETRSVSLIDELYRLIHCFPQGTGLEVDSAARLHGHDRDEWLAPLHEGVPHAKYVPAETRYHLVHLQSWV